MLRATAVLRPLLRAAPLAPRLVPASGSRLLHASSRVRAAEQPSNPFEDPRLLEIRTKIQNHQGAQEAIVKLGEVMRSKGIDLSQPPSPMQMLKLGMDSEIREAGQALMAQLNDAGIEITPEIASSMFSAVGEGKKDE